MGRAGAALTGGGGGASASVGSLPPAPAGKVATGGGTATTVGATTATTQPLTVDFSGENLVIIRKEIGHWDQLFYGPVWDGTEKPEIDFNGSHKLHIWKRLIDDYDQMLYGPVWDGREKPEIDFNGSHKLHIWKRLINDYDQMFYGPVYDGREKLPVNFGNRIQITGKYALDDWSDIFRGWLISNNTQEPGFRSIEKNFGTPGFVQITGKYALDDWSDIFRGWLISKNTQEAGFRPLEYNFGTPGFVEITGKAQFTAGQLFSPPSALDFFFLFADMVPSITTGLNSALRNFPVVPVNVASLIDFDASGISEAINTAVKEAISDRSYDAPQRLGFTSGRA